MGPGERVEVVVEAGRAIVVMVQSPSGTVVGNFLNPQSRAIDRERSMLPADFQALLDLIDRGLKSGMYKLDTTKIFLGGGLKSPNLDPEICDQIDDGFRYAEEALCSRSFQQVNIKQLVDSPPSIYRIDTIDGLVA